MKKFFIFIMVFILFVTTDTISYANIPDKKFVFVPSDNNSSQGTIIKNRLFSIALPGEMKGTYKIKKEKNKISVYHTESEKAGFGGFVFGIKAYKNPADHAVLPGSRKIGELTDKRGNLYDIVLKYPTDVQYDYTKGTKAPDSYKRIYDYGENVDIKGIKGSKYFKNRGMKGEDLYKDILRKYLTAINEKWDSIKLENENMSYMYNIISKNKIGYIYYDMNADGIDELLIGEIADGAWKGVIYDIYTMVDRHPRHVISGGNRNRYYVCNGTFVCNEYSSGALESGIRTYCLVENSTELFPQVNFKYDGYEDPKNPYFISYSDNKWENVSEKYFFERKKTFDKYERFNFISLIKASDSFKTPEEKFNPQKDYFDYSVLLTEFPENYFYTTIKINKSKERILIITDRVNPDKNSYRGLFYYFAKNGFVYPLGLIESTQPLSHSKNYLYYNDGMKDIKFYISDKKHEIVKKADKLLIIEPKGEINQIKFETIKSADKFAGDFGEPAGDDVVKAVVDGFYFEYHKPQYKKKYIKNLMKECIKDGVKTNVQMYCCMVNKLHEKKE